MSKRNCTSGTNRSVVIRPSERISYRSAGFGEPQNCCKTETAGAISLCVMFFMFTIADAAS